MNEDEKMLSIWQLTIKSENRVGVENENA